MKVLVILLFTHLALALPAGWAASPFDPIDISLGSEAVDPSLGLLAYPEMARETPAETPSSPDAPPVTEGPTSFAVDGSGNLFFLDTINTVVKKFGPDGKQISAFPYPVLNRDREYRYTDLQVDSKGFLYLLDAENNLVPVLTPAGELVKDRVIRVPNRSSKQPILLDQFNLLGDGSLIFSDLQTGNVFQILATQKSKNGFNAARLWAGRPTYQTALLVDPQERLIGFQTDFDNPEIIEIFAHARGEKQPTSLFKTDPLPGLVFLELVGIGHEQLLFLIYTGGEDLAKLTEARSYDPGGTLQKKESLDLPEIPWRMTHRARWAVDTLYLLESRLTEKKLRIHRIRM